MLYAQQSITVEAVQVARLLYDARHDWQHLPAWVRDHYEDGKILFLNDALELLTPNGALRGERSDWLLKLPKGAPFLCAADVFRMMYTACE